MKKFLALLLCVCTLAVACIGFTACDSTTDGSKLTGFDIELAKATGEYLGVEVRFQEINWDNKVVELNAKNIDLVWNGMTILDDLKDKVAISEPYMLNKQVAVVSTENASKFTTFEQIKAAKSIIAETGSAGLDYATKNLSANTIAASSQSAALMEIMSGTSEVAVIDAVMANYLAVTGEYAGKIKVLDLLEGAGEEYYGIAARKEDTGVINKVNMALAKFYNDGTMQEIADEFGVKDILVSDIGNYTDNGETAGWDYIANKGTLIIGYTVYAPIAFEK